MKNTSIISIFTLFLLTSLYATNRTSDEGWKFKIVGDVIGVIYDIDLDTDKKIGTGFVARDSLTVITAGHVAKYENVGYYRGVASGKLYKVSLDIVIEDKDVGLLRLSEPVEGVPIEICDTNCIDVNDTIIYCGFDFISSKPGSTVVFSDQAKVESIGEFSLKGRKAPFFDYWGRGIPGYSGGPVFNIKGKVIGIVIKGSWVRPVKAKPGTERLLNRAVIIDHRTFE